MRWNIFWTPCFKTLLYPNLANISSSFGTDRPPIKEVVKESHYMMNRARNVSHLHIDAVYFRTFPFFPRNYAPTTPHYLGGSRSRTNSIKHVAVPLAADPESV